MKRILLVSPFPPGLGGVSVSSQRLYDNLINDGYDVDIYNIRFQNDTNNNPILLALRYFWIPFYIVLHNKYDIIHFHVPGVMRKVYTSLCKPLFKGAKIIYTLHGDVKHLLASSQCLWALSKADRIICVQPGDSAKLPSYLKQKAVDNPAFILPVDINDDNIPLVALDFAKRRDNHLIMFYGSVRLQESLYDLYGINDVVKLYKQIKDSGVPARILAFVSYDKQKPNEVRFIESFRHQVSNEQDFLIIENNSTPILSLYKYAKVYLRPTKTDGDSLAVREAIALGSIVVATDVTNRPDGCILYHDYKELYDTVVKALMKPHQGGSFMGNVFYEKTKEIYNTL